MDLDATTATNEDSARFAADTCYVTEADAHGVSAVFTPALRAAPDDVLRPVTGAPWWLTVPSAA